MRLSALLLLLLVACSDTPPPLVECEPAGPYTFYPAAEERAIETEMAKWNAVTVEGRRLSFSLHGHQRILLMRPYEPSFQGQWLTDGVMFLEPGPELGERALHELGHALGLGHVDVRGAVMCGAPFDCGPTRPRELTAADIAEGRRVGACP